MKAFAILIKQDNDIHYLMTRSVADVIKKNHGAAVLSGYNAVEYVACIVFKKKADREQCAAEFARRNIKYKTRDDAIIEDGLL